MIGLCRLSGAQAAQPLAWRRAERARDQLRAFRSVLDLERMWQAIRPVVDDESVLGVFPTDLLVDLGRRRRRPGSELDQCRSPDHTVGVRQSWFEPPVQEGVVHRAAILEADERLLGGDDVVVECLRECWRMEW
jgi:hypothetical protein